MMNKCCEGLHSKRNRNKASKNHSQMVGLVLISLILSSTIVGLGALYFIFKNKE